MLNYEKWKKLNEALGPTTLGLSHPASLGITGARFSDLDRAEEDVKQECGCNEDEMDVESDEESDEDAGDDMASMKHHHLSDMDGDVGNKHGADMQGDEEDEDEDEEDDEGFEDEDDDDVEEDEDDEEFEDEDDDDEDDEDDEDEEFEDEDEDEEEDDEEEDEDMEATGADMQAPPPEDMEESAKKQALAEAAWWESVNSMIGVAKPINEEVKKPKLVGKPATAAARFETFLTKDDVKNLNMTQAVGLIMELLDHIEDNNDKMTPSLLRTVLLNAINKYATKKKLPKVAKE